MDLERALLGERIKELREQRGLTQARLGREAGVSDAYIAQIEKGQRRPSDDVLRRVSAALGLHPLHLPMEFGRMRGYVSDKLQYDIEQYAVAVQSGDPERIRNMALGVEASLGWEGLNEWGDTADWVLEMEGVLPVAPPEGWDRLSQQDRQLLQRLIERILTGGDYA